MKTSLLTLTRWLSVSVVWAAFPDAHGSYPFGVLNQRTLTVEYRNPILRYVPAKSGVDEKSSYRTPEDPATVPVAFANPCGMTGYFAPMGKRLKSGISVMPVCAGNQEAAMAQIKVGKVAADSVNHKVMTDYSRRENFRYRVLYESEPYLHLGIMAHPQAPESISDKVRATFIGTTADPGGQRVLAVTANRIGLSVVQDFVVAKNSDTDNCRRFLRNTQVPLDDQ